MIALIERFSRNFPHRRYDGENIYIRPPSSKDWREWSKIRSESREFLEPWEPTWPEDALTRETYRRRLQQHSREAREEEGYAFFIFRQKDNILLGGINVSNVSRGIRMSCSIGYWIGRRYARQGYMTEAIKIVVGFIFEELHLFRIEAGCVPTNYPSSQLLKNLGFQEEGYARKYLNINGRRHDHILFSLLVTDKRPLI